MIHPHDRPAITGDKAVNRWVSVRRPKPTEAGRGEMKLRKKAMTAKNGQKSFSRNNKTKLESCVSMRNRHAKGEHRKPRLRTG